jgi:hypothetical protein
MGFPNILTFKFSKKNRAIRAVTNYRKLKSLLKCHPLPIPKTGDILRSIQGFSFASESDLNMGYFHIKLDYDTDSQKLFIIVFPWHMGKYKHKPIEIKIAWFMM